MIFVILLFSLVSGRIYERCELARELKDVHGAPLHQLATWVCIARHESEYRTHVVGHMGEPGTGDHGIFQLNDRYWCSPPGKGQACGLTCAQLEDDDIADDFKCAQKIYKEHKKLSGDGFNAWAVYQPYCKGSKAEKYLKDCFNQTDQSLVSGNELRLTEDKRNKQYEASSKTPAKNDLFKSTQSAPATTTRMINFVRNAVKPYFFEPQITRSFTTNKNSIPKTTTTRPEATSQRAYGVRPITVLSIRERSNQKGYSSSEPISSIASQDGSLRIANRPIFVFNGVRWLG